MNEFELIARYFSGRGPKRKDVVLGIGDDAAVIIPPAQQALVVATDTLVESVHFLPDASPRSLGHRALAVNISDFAAMGAEPAWASIALTLPRLDEKWLQEFSDGLYAVAEYYGVSIVGGDTTRGPLTVTVSLKGHVPTDKVITRSGAKNGDWVYVTGRLGASALAVSSLTKMTPIQPEFEQATLDRFNYPSPRLAAGQVLRHVATSAIDVSDGLLQDLGHIIKASKVGVEIDVAKLPIDIAVSRSVSPEQAVEIALTGGEDYELLFTIPEEKKGYLEQNATAMGVEFTRIGQIKGTEGTVSLTYDGQPYQLANKTGYQHF